jgi:hypothetical protein
MIGHQMLATVSTQNVSVLGREDRVINGGHLKKGESGSIPEGTVAFPGSGSIPGKVVAFQVFLAPTWTRQANLTVLREG